MKKVRWATLILFILVVVRLGYHLLSTGKQVLTGVPGEVVELIFELDNKFEFGEYYFDLDNGKAADYPLCFCLTEKNMFPPECSGHVKYIYRNAPGFMCVPLNIGRGNCSVRIMSSSHFASVFYIPLEYQWVKTREKIIIGISIPSNVRQGNLLAVQVNIFQRTPQGELTLYRSLEQAIEIVNKK